jgi:hypothetical protein
MTDALAHTNPPTASEVWFDTYLRAHGYTCKPEPDLGIAKRPDRLIARDGATAVCEVKQFDKDPLAWMHETGQGGFIDEHKPVRRAVKQAAHQLRPLRGHGLPLVVVLANPNGFHIDLSGEQVVFALYGDDALIFTVWTGDGPPPPDFPDPPEYKRVVGRNGQIRVVGQYISAVVMLHRRKPDFFDLRDEADVPEDECWVEVIPAISEEAVPLPDSFFNGPNDLRWRYDRESERIEREVGGLSSLSSWCVK